MTKNFVPPLFQMWRGTSKQIITSIEYSEICCLVVTFLSNSTQNAWGKFRGERVNRRQPRLVHRAQSTGVTDRQTCFYQRPAALAFCGPKKFVIFKIRCLSISENILQKHRLITRKIIFIVPPLYPRVPVAPPMSG